MPHGKPQKQGKTYSGWSFKYFSKLHIGQKQKYKNKEPYTNVVGKNVVIISH